MVSLQLSEHYHWSNLKSKQNPKPLADHLLKKFLLGAIRLLVVALLLEICGEPHRPVVDLVTGLLSHAQDSFWLQERLQK